MRYARSLAGLLVATVCLASVAAQQPPRLTAQTLRDLKGSSNDPGGDHFVDSPDKLRTLIDAFVADNSLVSPMYLILAANTALRIGRLEDAAFLFYAGQIRARFDFDRYDISSRPDGNNLATYLGFLMHTTGEGLNRAIFREPKQFAAAIQRIETWEVVPADQAFYPEYEEAKGFKVQRAEWPKLAQSIKTDFLDVFGRRYAKLLNTPEYFKAMMTVQNAHASTTEPDVATVKRVETALQEMDAIEKRLFPNTPERPKPTLTVTPGELKPVDEEAEEIEPTLVPLTPDDPPVRVGSKVPAPKKLKHVEPQFERGLRGSMIVELTIDREGHVEIINVLRGDLELLEAVDKAVRQWRFEPVVIDGKPVKVLQPFTFAAK